MGICWYCHYGWPEQVAAIHDKYDPICDLHFGRGHIVWEDENFETEHIEWCLRQPRREDESDDDAVIESLRELLAVPECIRCPRPDYDGERVADFPPPPELKMVKR